MMRDDPETRLRHAWDDEINRSAADVHRLPASLQRELRLPRSSMGQRIGKFCLIVLAVLAYALIALLFTELMAGKRMRGSAGPSALASVFIGAAVAQECRLGDFGCGHARWHHWYSTAEDGRPLTRPYGPPGVSCCGVDCRPTLARFRDGQWFALIDGQWDPVPADRIKDKAVSPNGMAHVCAPKRENAEPVTPYCFVRPGGDS